MVLRWYMCGCNCVYHDLNVWFYGRSMVKKTNSQRNYIFYYVYGFWKWTKMYLHPNSSLYQMCISKRQSISLLILSGNTNLFLDLKQYHRLEHAEIINVILIIFICIYFDKEDIYFVQENEGKFSLWWKKNLALNLKEIKTWHLSISTDMKKNYRAKKNVWQ